MLIKLLFIIFVAIKLQCNGAVVSSIDMGSEWLKVAVVNIKPGQVPISIAINEMSKRKSPSLVAFHGPDRFLGEEAASITARYPEKVYSRVRDLIGKSNDYVKRLLGKSYLPYDIVEDLGIRIDDHSTVYSATELTGMVLGHALNLAEFHSKVAVTQAVITLPPYFGQAERKGLLQAAQLAGISVLSLINEHSAAALQYGIDKDFQTVRDMSSFMIWVLAVRMLRLFISQLITPRNTERLSQ